MLPVMESRVCESVVDAVGNTPMVRLARFVPGGPAEVYAKVEFLNPMGSIKDRLARHFIESAEKDGRLKPGATIVESSSGNTALGLAMMAIVKGYRCKMIVRDSISREKKNFLRLLGVELVTVDSKLPRESPDSYNNISERIVRETPNAFYPDQHNNRENNEAHYRTTGPEIWEQMDGRIDYFVAGIGTGGTLSGVARFLKEKDPRIRVVGVDPVGSVFYEYFKTGKLGESKRYLIEGLGDEFIIRCVQFELIDRMIQVSDREAFQCARELARKEALMAGGSSGAVVCAARKLAQELTGPARIVTVLPDSAFRYSSQFYDDEWLRDHDLA